MPSEESVMKLLTELHTTIKMVDQRVDIANSRLQILESRMDRIVETTDSLEAKVHKIETAFRVHVSNDAPVAHG